MLIFHTRPPWQLSPFILYFFFISICSHSDFSNREVVVVGGAGVHHYSGSYFSSGPHLISFLSFSSLTHSRQLIISLFPQIPQCTCNYHAHTCLPPASCLEGGVSISLSLFTSLSLSSPSSSLLSFLIFFFFPPSVIFLLLQVSFLFSRSLPLYVLFHWDKTLKFNNKLLSRSTSSFAFFKMKNNKKC